MEFIKERYFFIGLALIIFACCILIKTNSYEFETRNLEVIVNHSIENKEFISLKNKFLVYNIVSNALIAFGSTLIITMFFAKYFDKKEKDQLTKKLEEIQIETGRNAYLSLFHQLLDESFFDCVKKDIINCKVIRKNAKWIYDIESSGGKLVLKRTIIYSLKNLSTENVVEPIQMSSLKNSYTNCEIVEMKYTEEGKDEIKIDIESNTKEKDGEKNFYSEIKILPQKTIEVMKSFKQSFNTDFIYETHFSNNPLSDLEIEVNYPSDYVFKIGFNTKKDDFTNLIKNDNKQIWKSNFAILKGQGIEFFCEKK